LKNILIYGYGNPGRQDDGLGILLAGQMEEWAQKNDLNFISFDSNYQLNIEDALTISAYDMVIFADASVEEISDFMIDKVEPQQKTEFTMHAMSPDFVLHLCQSLYNKYPQVYLLHIKGYEFEFMEPLTEKARQNLEMSRRFLVDILSDSMDPKGFMDQISLRSEHTNKITSS